MVALSPEEVAKIRRQLFIFLEEKAVDLASAFSTEEIMKIKLDAAFKILKDRDALLKEELVASLNRFVTR